MNFKRMAGFLLALVLILSQLPAQVLAAGSVPAAGPAAVTGLTGAGTQEDPYQISSEAELIFAAEQLNGKNSASRGDTAYTSNVYAAGQALFDAEDPLRFIARLDKPFFVPTEEFEKSGQYRAGTVFIEGMAWYQGKWFLYYGCADSRVGVAISE